MKRFVRIVSVLLVLLSVLATSMLGCSSQEDLPTAIKPTNPTTGLDLVKSSYVTNRSLAAEELHINNDYSGWMKYKYNGSSEDLSSDMESFLKEINRLRYTEKEYDQKGYRLFYMNEGDLDESGENTYVTIRFVNITWCHDNYYKIQTVEEYLESSGTVDMNYKFESFSNPGTEYSLVNASEKDQKQLKICSLQNLNAGLKLSFEGFTDYYYNVGGASKNAEEIITITNADSMCYFVYNEAQPVDVMLIVLIAVAVLILAAVVALLIVIHKRKKS